MKIDEKKRKGSALAMVLVFMVMMSILGAGALAAAQHSARHSTAAAQADKVYYATESITQTAAQIFLEKAEEMPFCVERRVSGGDNAHAIAAEMADELCAMIEGRMAEIELEIIASVEGMEINGNSAGAVTITAPELRDKIESSYEIYVNELDRIISEGTDITGYVITYDLIAYVKEPIYHISVTAGGRTVTARAAYDTQVRVTRVEITPPVTGGMITGGSVSYQEKTGGIYGTGSGTSYDDFVSGLNALFLESDAQFEASRTVENIIRDENFPAEATHYNWNDAVSSRYINTWETVVLGRDGEITVYPELEYIRSGNGLEIRGTVISPNLKGIISVGGNFYGTLHANALENVYLGGGNLNIHSGAKINPMTVDASGNITDTNKPQSGGTNIFGETVLHINGSTEINWCRFNMSNIEIDYGMNGKLTSNSIFISRNHLNTHGTISADTSRVVPQFYMRGYINLSRNLGTISGIYMTPDTRYVCNNGNGVAPGTTFTGLFVGNYDVHFVQVDGENHFEYPIQAEVHEFGEREKAIMMDGGLIGRFLEGTMESAPGTVTIEMQADKTYEGLYLHESTGE